MTTSADADPRALAVDVSVTATSLSVRLADGRTVSVPTDWFPRLVHASEAERRAWTLIGDGSGIHWPAVDEDISVSALIAGERSNESPPSLRRWLDSRQE